MVEPCPALSPAWMMLRMQTFEPLLGHQRVDLGRRQRTVPKQHLQGAQISAMIEQMGGKRMSQHMRRNALACNSSTQRVILDQGPEHLPGHACTTGRHEQCINAHALEQTDV